MENKGFLGRFAFLFISIQSFFTAVPDRNCFVYGILLIYRIRTEKAITFYLGFCDIITNERDIFGSLFVKVLFKARFLCCQINTGSPDKYTEAKACAHKKTAVGGKE
jgi:hypothetical protein